MTSNQVGFYPIRKLVQREKARNLVHSAISAKCKWPGDALTYIKIMKQMNIKCLEIAISEIRKLSGLAGE